MDSTLKSPQKNGDLAQKILALIHDSEDSHDPNSAQFDLRVALMRLLRSADLGGQEVHIKKVVMLLSDIRGFSEIAEVYAARDVVSMLNRYFEAMSGIIVEYGGTIDKLMGDSILVTFGLPDRSANDVERAIACAVEMQQAMGKFNTENERFGMPPIYMGIGINYGEVVVGALGSEHYRENTIIGEEVNLVSRIEAYCLRGQILISEPTFLLARDYIQVSSPNSVEVKGSRDPINLYEVYATSRPRTMNVPRRDGRKSPRVGVQMPVVFQCLAGKLILPEKLEGQVVDISYGGMLIESDSRLAVLSEIKIKISLAVFSDESTDIFARIIKSEQQGSKFLSSMEFTFVDQTGQAAIKNLVDRVLLTI